MMYHSSGKQDLIERFDLIYNISTQCFQDGNTNMQVAYSTLFFNLSVVFLESNQPSGERIIEGTDKLLRWISDETALFRCLQTLVNLLCSSDNMLFSKMVGTSSSINNALSNISSNSKNLDLQCITLKLLKALN